jgi:hypothetical protein
MAPDLKDQLKLAILDADDLAVASAHLQDAVTKVGDMAYLPTEKRFAMLVNRFDWTAVEEGAALRRRAGVHFERVLKARTRGFNPHDRETVLNLLTVEFEERDVPSGLVTLYFSGEAAIELEVECLEMALADLGPAWSARHRPRHGAT